MGPGTVYCGCCCLHGQQALGGGIQFLLPVVVFMGGKCQLLSGSGSVLLPVGHEAGQQSCQVGGEERGVLFFRFFSFIQLMQPLCVYVQCFVGLHFGLVGCGFGCVQRSFLFQ